VHRGGVDTEIPQFGAYRYRWAFVGSADRHVLFLSRRGGGIDTHMVLLDLNDLALQTRMQLSGLHETYLSELVVSPSGATVAFESYHEGKAVIAHLDVHAPSLTHVATLDLPYWKMAFMGPDLVAVDAIAQKGRVKLLGSERCVGDDPKPRFVHLDAPRPLRNISEDVLALAAGLDPNWAGCAGGWTVGPALPGDNGFLLKYTVLPPVAWFDLDPAELAWMVVCVDKGGADALTVSLVTSSIREGRGSPLDFYYDNRLMLWRGGRPVPCGALSLSPAREAWMTVCVSGTRAACLPVSPPAWKRRR